MNETMLKIAAIVGAAILLLILILIVILILPHTSWGLRKRGEKDGKSGAAHPYEENGWSSPFVEQQVKRINAKLAKHARRAERRQSRLYVKVAGYAAEVEKLTSRRKLLDERKESSVIYEQDIPELRQRRLKIYIEAYDHIAVKQADLVKEMAKLRSKINTRRQRYLHKADSLVQHRDERVNAYWAGVVSKEDDAPVTPGYNVNAMPEANRLYMARNNHVLNAIDNYIELYLQPEDVKNLEV